MTNGYIQKILLFGINWKGILSPDFSDNYFETVEKTAHLKRLHKRIELHPFQLNDTADNNPFIAVIESTGKRVWRLGWKRF